MLGMYQPYAPYPGGSAGGSMPPAPPVVAPQGSSAGPDPSILGLLRNMERDDLQRLDERTIDSLLADDKELRELSDQKVTEQTTNRSLAEHNLSSQSRLDQAKRSLIAAHREAFELTGAHRRLLGDLQRSGGAREAESSLENLEMLLQSGCLEAEEASDALLESLLAGRVDLSSFLTAYTDARVLYYTRRAKADKVTEIANQRLVSAPPQQQQQQQRRQMAPPAVQNPPYYYQQQAPIPQQTAVIPGPPSYYYPAGGGFRY